MNGEIGARKQTLSEQAPIKEVEQMRREICIVTAPTFPAAFIVCVTVADVMYIVSLLDEIDGMYALHQVAVMLLGGVCYLAILRVTRLNTPNIDRQLFTSDKLPAETNDLTLHRVLMHKHG